MVLLDVPLVLVSVVELDVPAAPVRLLPVRLPAVVVSAPVVLGDDPLGVLDVFEFVVPIVLLLPVDGALLDEPVVPVAPVVISVLFAGDVDVEPGVVPEDDVPGPVVLLVVLLVPPPLLPACANARPAAVASAAVATMSACLFMCISEIE